MKALFVVSVLVAVGAAALPDEEVIITGNTIDCFGGVNQGVANVGIWALDPIANDTLLASLREMDTVTFSGDAVEAMRRFEPMYERFFYMLQTAEALARDTTIAGGTFSVAITPRDSVLIVAQAESENEPIYYSFAMVPARSNSSVSLNMAPGQCVIP